MRFIGVKTEKGNLAVDEILGQNAGHHRLADATFFAADEMKPSHAC
jgi:hypothetical protein